MKSVILAIAALGLTVVLAGCETVKGLGRDISNTGSAVENALAKKH
ncbi:MAG: entericidin A/B family lipoprotein [Candidatus Omnitrophica bacterium]|nr:entericidin A/B family lipoprotein [Candidatus Omnitrophota bacterium]